MVGCRRSTARNEMLSLEAPWLAPPKEQCGLHGADVDAREQGVSTDSESYKIFKQAGWSFFLVLNLHEVSSFWSLLKTLMGIVYPCVAPAF